uniref:Uncharacterized protein LOC111111440 n=1 Tax=Crassostrea virginica TaxID=6565 RepID=A0A8B8BMR1_CRAVI|nr:uncharacterized protein LOC111111440 [Crassostrea virginica]
MVFQCGKFQLDQGKINDFLRPPTQTIEDILASPQKRNVSCRGILRKISDIIESPTSKRRELTLESLEGRSSVVCKLWGDQADLLVPAADTIITAVCVQVSNWKGNISLNSSVLTSLQETDEESGFEGEVEAVEILESFSYIIVADKTLKISAELLLTVFPNNEFLEGMRVLGKCRGATVAEIKVLNPKKKKKENQM